MPLSLSLSLYFSTYLSLPLYTPTPCMSVIGGGTLQLKPTRKYGIADKRVYAYILHTNNAEHCSLTVYIQVPKWCIPPMAHTHTHVVIWTGM